MHSVNKTEFFDGIDGLRAIAVLSVVAFHLNALLPAGFVGVDVFFVISGFVVFGACGTLNHARLRDFLLGFYARRVIRIVPALLVCVLVSFGLMVLFVPLGTDGRFSERNTVTALAALVGGANMALSAGASDYWSARSEFNPFTHTWSLGVEEQFYVLAPVIFLAWYRGRKASAALILAVMAIASVVTAAAWGTSVKSFYLLPARFWELAAGVALYMCMPWWRARLMSFRGDALAAGGVALLGTSFLVTETGGFPWPGAVLPVVATLMLIMAVVSRPDGWLNRLLTLRAVQWVGKRSYAIYLWHWPVFVLLRWTVGLEAVVVQIAALAATLLLGAASMVWVEQPAKRLLAGRSVGAGGGAVLPLVSGSLAIVGMALLIVLATWFRPQLTLSTTGQQSVWNYTFDIPDDRPRCKLERQVDSVKGGFRYTLSPVDCPAAGSTVFVAGDSHAGAYMAALRRLVRQEAVKVVLYTRPACPVFGMRRPIADEDAACNAFITHVLDEIRSNARAGDSFFLPGLRLTRFRDSWDDGKPVQAEAAGDRSAAVADALQRLAPLGDAGVNVLLEAPKPLFKAPPFRCADWFNASNPICADGFSVSRAELAQRRGAAMAALGELASRGKRIAIYDPMPILCDDTAGNALAGNEPLFFDGDHLSAKGNAVLYPSLSKALGH